MNIEEVRKSNIFVFFRVFEEYGSFRWEMIIGGKYFADDSLMRSPTAFPDENAAKEDAVKVGKEFGIFPSHIVVVYEWEN